MTYASCVATVGEQLGLGDAVLRCILNHTAPTTDVLHRRYIGLNEGDVTGTLEQVQEALLGLMLNANKARQNPTM